MVDQVAYTMGYTNAIQTFASQTLRECQQIAATAPKVGDWGKQTTAGQNGQTAATGESGAAMPKIGFKEVAMSLIPTALEMFTKSTEEKKKAADKVIADKKSAAEKKEAELKAEKEKAEQRAHEIRLAEIKAKEVDT